MPSKIAYLAQTRHWLEQFVIQYQLCPFAKKPFDEGKIRYRIFSDPDVDALTQCFLEEVYFLAQCDPKEIETSLVVHPRSLESFLDFNDYTGWLEATFLEVEFDQQFQLATFHPHYQFAETDLLDPSNRTNQSPFPMLHILRSESLEQVIDNYGDTSKIPERNIALMNQLFA